MVSVTVELISQWRRDVHHGSAIFADLARRGMTASYPHERDPRRWIPACAGMTAMDSAGMTAMDSDRIKASSVTVGATHGFSHCGAHFAVAAGHPSWKCSFSPTLHGEGGGCPQSGPSCTDDVTPAPPPVIPAKLVPDPDRGAGIHFGQRTSQLERPSGSPDPAVSGRGRAMYVGKPAGARPQRGRGGGRSMYVGKPPALWDVPRGMPAAPCT